ncbi:unnamed protein product [marine sediment metagenome]|uniref:Uncharacterized protein n=1 Tax=marine sediment metagenome TaxID=412755 RepID=X1RAV4_9ZZZZ
MKILLISPSKNSNFKKPKFLLIPQLSLHLLAGLTPPEYDVKIIEEEIEDINLGDIALKISYFLQFCFIISLALVLILPVRYNN